MRKWVVAAAWAAVCGLVVTAPRPATADILVNISKTSQRMSVLVDGSARYTWLVSTGAKRYTTPNGVYKPQWMARKWRSRQYKNAPMPHSIFFHKGYAIHGTNDIKRLGKIASHGCVRLHPENAAKLFSLVQNQMANTRVVVSNDIIEAPGEAPKKKPGQFVAENTASEDPVAAPKNEPSTVGASGEISIPENALVAEKLAAPRARQISIPENALVAEKIAAPRAMAKALARPARAERVARASTGAGFHW